ncbi:MAG: mandelate racemase/muconate lactonizing enzyme family protein [Hyphomicrobiaceae bacterium]
MISVKSVDVIGLQVPFQDGSAGVGLMPGKWTKLDFALVRVETHDGVIGWGDGFGYGCRRATIAMLEDMVAPLVVGTEIDDIPEFNLKLQQRLHLHGRYGITMFAISAIDIALWDIAAKIAGLPLAELLGGRQRSALPAYASLVRYGEPDLVAAYASKAVSQGYGTIKLHEIERDPIIAGRDAVGPDIKLATDVNCNWSQETAELLMPLMKQLDLYWVEEPVFPSDQAESLGALQEKYGVSIASGENACTSVEFARLAPRIAYVQPSVTKVGGISEFLNVCDLADEHAARVMPHAPYFGPGYWATLHLMAARSICEQFEHFFINPDSYLDPSIPLPVGGSVHVPDRPGHGFEPVDDEIHRFQV